MPPPCVSSVWIATKPEKEKEQNLTVKVTLLLGCSIKLITVRMSPTPTPKEDRAHQCVRERIYIFCSYMKKSRKRGRGGGRENNVGTRRRAKVERKCPLSLRTIKLKEDKKKGRWRRWQPSREAEERDRRTARQHQPSQKKVSQLSVCVCI